MKKTKVLCFGGGTGLPTLLSGLKNNPWLEITAVVNMFDTGGSSGELRDRFGILPPGDVLKCMLGLSTHEQYVREMLLTRISNDEMPGHTGGNILLLGLQKVYGDYLSAIDALGQLLSVKGKVMPVTLEPSHLVAVYKDGSSYKGETNVDVGLKEGKIIVDLYLEPEVPAYEAAVSAIEKADVICVGPGSFYTSVLPNFLPTGIREAIIKSDCPVIYIANLLTEGKGMGGMRVEDCLRMLEEKIGVRVARVVFNQSDEVPRETLRKYAAECKFPFRTTSSDLRFVPVPLWDGQIARHDPDKLGYLVSSLISEFF